MLRLIRHKFFHKIEYDLEGHARSQMAFIREKKSRFLD